MINFFWTQDLFRASSCKLTPDILPKLPKGIYDHMVFLSGDKIVICGGHVRYILVNATFYLKNQFRLFQR